MYQEYIMEHYRYPRYRGTLDNPCLQAWIRNVSCGDHIIVQGTVEDGRLIKVVFEGAGCVISQAAASMLMEYAQGKRLDDLLAFDKNAMRALLGLELGPLRIRCGLLVLEAIHTAINKYQVDHKKE